MSQGIVLIRLADLPAVLGWDLDHSLGDAAEVDVVGYHAASWLWQVVNAQDAHLRIVVLMARSGAAVWSLLVDVCLVLDQLWRIKGFEGLCNVEEWIIVHLEII